MADGDGAATATQTKPGKTFSFNMTGDDFHLYETVKAAYEDERESEDERFRETLDALPVEARRLIESRLAPTSAKKSELSQREVFVRALRVALDVLDAEADSTLEEEDPEAAEAEE